MLMGRERVSYALSERKRRDLPHFCQPSIARGEGQVRKGVRMSSAIVYDDSFSLLHECLICLGV